MMTDLGSLEYHLLTRFHKFDKDIKPSKNESFIILPLDGAESCGICSTPLDFSFVQISSQNCYTTIVKCYISQLLIKCLVRHFSQTNAVSYSILTNFQSKICRSGRKYSIAFHFNKMLVSSLLSLNSHYVAKDPIQYSVSCHITAS